MKLVGEFPGHTKEVAPKKLANFSKKIYQLSHKIL